MNLKKLTIYLVIILCGLGLNAYLHSLSISKEPIKKIKINNYLKLEKDFYIRAQFFDNDKKVIFSDAYCGIYIFNIKKERIEYILRPNHMHRISSDDLPKCCRSINKISPNKKYWAVSECESKADNTISLYSLSNYIKIAEFNLRGFSGQSSTLYFSEDSKFFYAIELGKEGKSVEIQGWQIGTKKKIIDSKLIIHFLPEYYIPYIFANNYYLVLRLYLKNSIRIYDIRNMMLYDKIVDENIDVNANAIYAKGQLFYIERLTEKKLNNGNNITNIKSYNMQTKKKNYLLSNVYNPTLEAFINDSILIYQEMRFAPSKTDNNEYNYYPIYDWHIKYYDIIGKKILYDFDMAPNCYVNGIADNGRIWFLICEEKTINTDSNSYEFHNDYFLAYPQF